MGAPFRVRPALPSDQAGMLAVEYASFPVPWGAEDFSADRPWVRFVAEGDGDIVGFILGRHVLDEGEVLNVAVVPGWRGCGVGHRLVEELIAAMSAKGVESVYLEVRESNVSAHSLYRRLGFEIVGLRAGYYSDPPENAVQMKRILSL